MVKLRHQLRARAALLSPSDGAHIIEVTPVIWVCDWTSSSALLLADAQNFTLATLGTAWCGVLNVGLVSGSG